MGCSDRQWPPQKMFAPVDVPAESDSIHPWIAELLKVEVADAKLLLNERLASDTPELYPLIQVMKDFMPIQVVFSHGVGYLRCVRRYKDQATLQTAYYALYIAQPLSDDLLEWKVSYFNSNVQPLARELLKRFAGSGEEMEGHAGQFSFRHWPSAADFRSEDSESYGEWRDAKELYAALNGDSVFIQPNGATVWHTIETDELIPIADNLEEFIKLYAGFRETHEVFDAWNYRDYHAARSVR